MRCTKEVYTDAYLNPTRQCKRLAVMGKFCQQHTPEAIKKREEEKKELFENTRRLKRQEWSGPSAVRLIKKARQDLLDKNPEAAELKLRTWLNDNDF